MIILSILSSIAVIVYTLVTFAQYQLSKRQHHNQLVITELNRRKRDFISWFDEYLRLAHLAMRTTIALNMDMLENSAKIPDEAAHLREQRIAENVLRQDRYNADLDYQILVLSFVVDDRQPYFQEAQAKIRVHHEQVRKLRNDFRREIHTTFMDKMAQAKDLQEVRDVMSQARAYVHRLSESQESDNHELSEIIKSDIHALEDQILKYV